MRTYNYLYLIPILIVIVYDIILSVLWKISFNDIELILISQLLILIYFAIISILDRLEELKEE